MTLQELAANKTPKIRHRKWPEGEFIVLQRIKTGHFYFDADGDDWYPFSVEELAGDYWEEFRENHC